tara:strand:- start:476 stop:1630 length:1155 start_codon:yes stop_codon:yes gene_type:complete
MKKLFFYFLALILIYLVVFSVNFFAHRHYFNINSEARQKHLNHRTASLKKFLISEYKPIVFPKYFHKKEIRQKFVNEFIPFNSVPYRKVFLCDEGYGMIKYTADRFGFRNNDLIWQNVNENNKKIMIIGDSFAQGQCVREEFYINNLLKEKLNKNANIYNLSSAGNGPAINSSVLSGFVDIIKPNIILIILFSNDRLDKLSNPFISQSEKKLDKYFKFENNQPYISDEVMETLLRTEKYIIELNKEKSSFSNYSFFQKLKKYLFLEFSRKKLYEIYLKAFFSLPNSTKFFIDLANEKCFDKCKLIFTYISPSEYWSNEPFSKKYKYEIIKYLDKLNLTFIDLSKIIDTSNMLDYAPKGPHLSNKGYEKISSEIYKEIKKTNFSN